MPAPDALRALLARYDRPGPRYTSYPTVPVWTERFGPDDYVAELESAAPRLAVYLHVPFCERLCSYCACNRTVTRDHSVAGPYLDALEREADLLARALGEPRSVAQLAIGGGTPTFLSELELERAIAIVDSRLPPEPEAERSIELDPRVTTRGHLEVLAARGFTRFSLGVQDLDPRVQQAIRRIQTFEQTQELCASARAMGVSSVSFDLIYGLPFQTASSFARTIERVLEARPDRIALYSYAHVTWVSAQQRGFERADLPGPERKLALFRVALETLERAGYVHLGLDHFVLPHDALARAAQSGTLQRNFMGYTIRAADELIALGPSGISELARAYAQAAKDPDDWQKRLRGGQLAIVRGLRLSEDDVRRRWLIQRLMCSGEIDPVAYSMRFAEPLEDRIPDLRTRLSPFVDDGLVGTEGSRYTVLPIGRLFLRSIAMSFDAHLESSVAERPVFSRTV